MADRFQSIPGYEDFARKPQVVVGQTDTLLQLYQKGGIRRPELAREYLQDYTMPLLGRALQGVERVFGNDRRLIDEQHLEMNEAADYAQVVFAWMHALAESPFLPMGFSRRGVLQAPQNREQFERRIREMQRELALIVSGLREPHQILEAQPSAFRTNTFFNVGSRIPLKLPDDGRAAADYAEEVRRKQVERERAQFNRILGDTPIDFS